MFRTTEQPIDLQFSKCSYTAASPVGEHTGAPVQQLQQHTHCTAQRRPRPMHIAVRFSAGPVDGPYLLCPVF